ncbi:hypothetical protein DL769_002992 [Monosporascus sp. CRB-8-3]|nr:hypothetical protein DL769_002992 [Monosporascus sp. CRB-8-3]
MAANFWKRVKFKFTKEDKGEQDLFVSGNSKPAEIARVVGSIDPATHEQVMPPETHPASFIQQPTASPATPPITSPELLCSSPRPTSSDSVATAPCLRGRQATKYDTRNQAHLSRYKYATLPPGKITRLVFVKPGKGDDELAISLRPSDLSEDYEALSWTWGTSQVAETVIVDGPMSKSIIYVKPTIRKALLSLRNRQTERCLWIDTICINQDDPDEKSVQVRSMSRIYRLALTVLIWLELPESDLKLTMETIGGLATLEDMTSIMNGGDGRKSALEKLVGNPWFGRRWIVQEIASARQALLVAADALHRSYTASWTDFCRTVRLLHEYHENHTGEKRSPDMDWKVEISTEAFNSSNAYNLVQVCSGLLGQSPSSSHRDPRIFIPSSHLEDILVMCTRFECEKGQDTIYALTALADDTLDAGDTSPSTKVRLGIDYNKNVLEVYQDFVNFAIRSSGGRTDIILRYWITRNHAKWDISWLKSGQMTTTVVANTRYSSREIIQRDLLGTVEAPLFTASGSMKVDPAFNLFTETSLTLEGFVLDSISSTMGCKINVIHKYWATYAGWLDTTHEPPTHFWMTLTAGLDERGCPAPSFYRSLCHKAFFNGRHFRLASSTSDAVKFELERVFCDPYDYTSQDIAWRWARFGFEVRLPDQQLKIVKMLEEMCSTGRLFLPLEREAVTFIRDWLSKLDIDGMIEMAKYRRLVLKTVMGRKLFKSLDRSLFGLVPKLAREGDL